MNKIDLSERMAIVTGGAQGFGLALNLGENVKTFQVDVTKFNTVERASEESMKIFGSVDILVNNAGIAGP